MTKRQGSVLETQLPLVAATFDPDAFDYAIQQHGVTMQHYRAMKCPVGLSDPHDARTSHVHHENCSNGFIYRLVGTVRVLFSGNTSQDRNIDPGFLDGSSVQVTFPRHYEDPEDKNIHVAPFDRLYLAQDAAEIPNWETIASVAGPERLAFPPLKVEHVIDSSGREYDKSLYSVQGGKLVWVSQDRPAPGTVITVWYVYKPFWYVSRILHEVRVGEVVDPVEGAKIVRMPYQAVLQRENVFKNVSNDIMTKDDDRKQDPPEERDFGLR